MSRTSSRSDKPKRSQPPRRSDDSFQVTIESMAQGGQALAMYKGQPVFVAYAIPGERVEVRLTRQAQGHAFAEGLRLLDASADRVLPRCPHFGPKRCWACQWQHIAYPAQLLLKFDLLVDALSRYGGFDDELLEGALRPVLPAPRQWAYSHSATLHPLEDGRLGFRRMAGGLEAIDACPLMIDLWNDAYMELDIALPDLRALSLTVDSHEQTSLTLHLGSEDLPELSTDLPFSINALTPDHEPLNLVGDSASLWQLGQDEVRITAGCFLRPNPTQVEALRSALLGLAALGSTERVLELYCGSGTLTQALAPHCATLVAVDSYPPAINDADYNLHYLQHQPHVRLIESACADFLDANRDAFDLVVADVPPSGLDERTLRALLTLQAPRLILIGSQLVNLARDLARLSQGGYALLCVQPIDPAPQTYYLDVLALLGRTTA
ncbi:MAG: methyltransferase domain-containing protein [Anaerolineae bacterium]|nr:methyltransferase domain-containing protein [Anaerolineae bacterium]MDW8173963.1 methyltransferase domain-containing protein [Anaerolineae bacterium]